LKLETTINSLLTRCINLILNAKAFSFKWHTCQFISTLRNRLATWLRLRFVRFHATSCLVNNKRVLLFAGSHMLLRLKCKKRGSSYELLPAWPKSNSCYCSMNSRACLHCALNSFFLFLKTVEACLHCSVNVNTNFFLFFLN